MDVSVPPVQISNIALDEIRGLAGVTLSPHLVAKLVHLKLHCNAQLISLHHLDYEGTCKFRSVFRFP